MHRGVDFKPRSRHVYVVILRGKAMQAALQFPEVLHPRDNFLAGVTALLETDAA